MEREGQRVWRGRWEERREPDSWRTSEEVRNEVDLAVWVCIFRI